MSKEKEAVYRYLEKVNRPYSANDILQNLHKEFGKGVIQKALDQLVTEKKVHEKTYAKQKIYSVLQKDDGNVNDVESELQRFETQILEKTDTLNKVKQELKQSEGQLKEFQSLLTVGEAETKRDELKSQIENMEDKLTKLSENKVLISNADRQKIKKKHETVVKEYKKRKRICMDIINSILEGYPKSKKALIEEIGLELDDEKKIPEF